MTKAPVAIVMGSDSDFDAIVDGLRLLDGFGLRYSLQVLSAEHAPDEVAELASTARKREVKVLIALASEAAHLAGVLAARTTLPVLGVSTGESLGATPLFGPISVGPLGIGRSGGTNAALLTARIISIGDERVAERLRRYREEQRQLALAKTDNLSKRLRAAKGDS